MNTKPDPNLDPAELAALYAAGALTREERAAFEARLDAGDAAALESVKSLDPVVEALAGAAQPVEPEAKIKEGLLERIASDQEPATPPLDKNVFMLRANEGQWQETGVEGVRIRVLFVDKEMNRQTFLVRMDPGTTFPSHPHVGVEECLVLEGDLTSAGHTMHIGDYQRAPAGGQHGVTSTKNGCLCLVTAAVA